MGLHSTTGVVGLSVGFSQKLSANQPLCVGTWGGHCQTIPHPWFFYVLNLVFVEVHNIYVLVDC